MPLLEQFPHSGCAPLHLTFRARHERQARSTLLPLLLDLFGGGRGLSIRGMGTFDRLEPWASEGLKGMFLTRINVTKEGKRTRILWLLTTAFVAVLRVV
jgi:hypothetical protein